MTWPRFSGPTFHASTRLHHSRFYHFRPATRQDLVETARQSGARLVLAALLPSLPFASTPSQRQPFVLSRSLFLSPKAHTHTNLPPLSPSFCRHFICPRFVRWRQDRRITSPLSLFPSLHPTHPDTCASPRIAHSASSLLPSFLCLSFASLFFTHCAHHLFWRACAPAIASHFAHRRPVPCNATPRGAPQLALVVGLFVSFFVSLFFSACADAILPLRSHSLALV